MAQGDGRQVRQVDLDDGQVGLGMPTTLALALRPSARATSILSAASTTWLLVRM
jgi:polynucleotide 5'-kinase involved in rRNA processing